MANTVDFILPSCYGIPESMWLVASAYKTFLMTFDYMIDSICFFKPEVIQQTARHTEKVAREESTLIKWLIKIISNYGGNLFLFTQQGVTYFMH